MKITEKAIKIVLAALLAVCLYIFWAFPYLAALSYHEQLQLFLLTDSYLGEHFAWPGGIATYIAEFLTQFYNNFWIGAAVITILLCLSQWLTWKLCKALTRKTLPLTSCIVSFIPTLALWLYMGDINVMLSLVVGIDMALAVGLIFTHIRRHWLQDTFALVVPPLFYWLMGTGVYLLLLIVCMVISLGKDKTYLKAIFCLLVIIYTVGMILLLTQCLPYPLHQQLVGINYYRNPTQVPWMQMVIMALYVVTITLTIAIAYYRQYRMFTSYVTASVLAIVLAFGVWSMVDIFYNPKTYELMEYDYLVRINDWQQIIQKAEKKQPDLPMSVCATNLALGMTGQLNNRAFDFYQNGAEGLVPPFKKETISSLITGEVYMNLGLVNTAQQFYFEAMEAIPNFNKSVRCIKHLAETNLIRGNYEVARKYLKLLEKTMCYGKWARRTMQMIDNPEKIDQHPLYGKLRRFQIDDDFLFSDIEIDKIVGQLYMRDPSNHLALQYLLLYPLLQRDVDRLMQFLHAINTDGRNMPTIIQQAVAFAFMRANMDIPDGSISPAVHQQFKDFARIWTSYGKDSPELERFHNTLWYYLLKND